MVAGRPLATHCVLNQHVGHSVDYPVEIWFTDRPDIRVRSWVHEINRVRNAIPYRELDSVEVVPQCFVEKQCFTDDTILQLIAKRPLLSRKISPLAWIVGHDQNMLPADTVAANIVCEVDELL